MLSQKNMLFALLLGSIAPSAFLVGSEQAKTPAAPTPKTRRLTDRSLANTTAVPTAAAPTEMAEVIEKAPRDRQVFSDEGTWVSIHPPRLRVNPQAIRVNGKKISHNAIILHQDPKNNEIFWVKSYALPTRLPYWTPAVQENVSDGLRNKTSSELQQTLRRGNLLSFDKKPGGPLSADLIIKKRRPKKRINPRAAAVCAAAYR